VGTLNTTSKNHFSTSFSNHHNHRPPASSSATDSIENLYSPYKQCEQTTHKLSKSYINGATYINTKSCQLPHIIIITTAAAELSKLPLSW